MDNRRIVTDKTKLGKGKRVSTLEARWRVYYIVRAESWERKRHGEVWVTARIRGGYTSHEIEARQFESPEEALTEIGAKQWKKDDLRTVKRMRRVVDPQDPGNDPRARRVNADNRG